MTRATRHSATCRADACSQGRKPCPCPTACRAPEGVVLRTDTHRPVLGTLVQARDADEPTQPHPWHLAGNTPTKPQPEGLSLAAHLGVVLLCIALLALIAMAAPAP